MVIKKLAPLNGSLRSWFDDATERDSGSRGQVTSPGVARSADGRLTLVRKFRTSKGAQSVAYLGYSVADRGRLLISSGPSDQVLVRGLREMGVVARQLGALDATRRADSTDSTQTRGMRRDMRRGSSTSTPIRGSGSRETRGGIAAGAGRGLKSAQVLGVYLNDSYGTGVGGMMITTFDAVLLLRDGSARRYLEIPPADLDLARDKAANARDWGRWTRGGKGFVVGWSDGDKDDLKSSFKTKPARPGQTMQRAYETIGGGGNTAMGGNVMVAYSNAYQFARNGTFMTDGARAASTASTEAAAGVYMSSRLHSTGSYKLDGHALTLRYNDGRVVRKLFYFYPDSERAIGIGDDTFTIDD